MDREAASFGRESRQTLAPRSVSSLIALVACFGLVVWAVRFLWERQQPELAALRELNSPTPSDRVHALRELGQFGHEDPGALIPPLIAALKDPDTAVRVRAADALTFVGSEALTVNPADRSARGVLTALCEASADKQASVRLTAIRSLGNILAHSNRGKATAVIDLSAITKVLVPALNDADSEVRVASLNALGVTAELGLTEPPQGLIAALTDSSAASRAAAVNALGYFRRSLDPWIPTLFRLLNDENAAVRAAAARTLDRLTPPAASVAALPALVEALAGKHGPGRFHAIQALTPFARDPRASAAVPSLLAFLTGLSTAEAEKEKTTARTGDDNASEEIQIAHSAMGLVGQIAPGTPNIRSARDAGPSAAALVGQIAPGTPFASEAVAVLTEVVRSGSHIPPEFAAQALADFGPAAEPALPELVKFARRTMATHGSAGPRAIEALGRIAPGTTSADDVVTVLLEALRSDFTAVRRAAIETLPKFGKAAARAIPAIRALLGDPDASIRSAAAAALEQRN
jgi:HEAT repeat protein